MEGVDKETLLKKGTKLAAAIAEMIAQSQSTVYKSQQEGIHNMEALSKELDQIVGIISNKAKIAKV